MSRYRQSREELEEHLREQLGFLMASAAAFDRGAVAEAVRIATTVRILVHDTRASTSLLQMLGLRETLRFVDTAVPVNPRNLLTHNGLTMMQVTAGGDAAGGAYVAPFAMLSPPRQNNPRLPFRAWWETPVIVDDNRATFSRRDLVLALAHKEGGAHVDPDIDDAYARLSRSNSLGFVVTTPMGRAPMPDPVRPSVREIGFEVEQTLISQVPAVLHPPTASSGEVT